VDVLVAAFADHKGLSLTHSHQVYPRRPFRPSWLVEIGEETMDQLISSGRSHDRISVRNDGGALTLERDSAEAGDQWLPSFIALHRDLEAGTPAAKGVDARLVSASHLPHRSTSWAIWSWTGAAPNCCSRF
jgi:hypothetical protein